MDKIRIVGGRPLCGEVRISGAKNAALPALFASLLTDSPCRIPNLPRLRDTTSALAALAEMGAEVGGDDSVCCANLRSRCAPYRLVKTMRASVLALGPLTAKWGEARVALPGGCAIGARPVNEHLSGLAKLGAEIRIENGDIFAQDAKRGAFERGADFDGHSECDGDGEFDDGGVPGRGGDGFGKTRQGSRRFRIWRRC